MMYSLPCVIHSSTQNVHVQSPVDKIISYINRIRPYVMLLVVNKKSSLTSPNTPLEQIARLHSES